MHSYTMHPGSLCAFHIGYTQGWYIQSRKFNRRHKTVLLPNVYIYTVINIFKQMIFSSRQMQSKPEEFVVRIVGAYSLDLSWMEDKMRTPPKNAIVHASLRKRDGLSLGITTCARSVVIWEISCATQTKMNVLTMMLSVGFPGMRTRMPLVSAASQMWYWQMNSSSEIFPNQAKKELYIERAYPGMFLIRMKATICTTDTDGWSSLHSALFLQLLAQME